MVMVSLGDSATSSFAPFPFLPLFAVPTGFASDSVEIFSLPAEAIFAFLLGLAGFDSAGLLGISASAPSSKSK